MPTRQETVCVNAVDAILNEDAKSIGPPADATLTEDTPMQVESKKNAAMTLRVLDPLSQSILLLIIKFDPIWEQLIT